MGKSSSLTSVFWLVFWLSWMKEDMADDASPLSIAVRKNYQNTWTELHFSMSEWEEFTSCICPSSDSSSFPCATKVEKNIQSNAISDRGQKIYSMSSNDVVTHIQKTYFIFAVHTFYTKKVTFFKIRDETSACSTNEECSVLVQIICPNSTLVSIAWDSSQDAILLNHSEKQIAIASCCLTTFPSSLTTFSPSSTTSKALSGSQSNGSNTRTSTDLADGQATSEKNATNGHNIDGKNAELSNFHIGIIVASALIILIAAIIIFFIWRFWPRRNSKKSAETSVAMTENGNVGNRNDIPDSLYRVPVKTRSAASVAEYNMRQRIGAPGNYMEAGIPATTTAVSAKKKTKATNESLKNGNTRTSSDNTGNQPDVYARIGERNIQFENTYNRFPFPEEEPEAPSFRGDQSPAHNNAQQTTNQRALNYVTLLPRPSIRT